MRKNRWYTYCEDPGCVCVGRHETIIEHNMLDGWSREMSEALLGEHLYCNNGGDDE